MITAKQARSLNPKIKTFNDILTSIERSIKSAIESDKFSCKWYLDEPEEVWELFDDLKNQIAEYLIKIEYKVEIESDAEVDAVFLISW